MSEPKLTTVWTGGRRKRGKDPVFGPWVKQIGTIRLPVAGVPPFYYFVRARCAQRRWERGGSQYVVFKAWIAGVK